jgi:hypothetical protein
MESWPVHVLLVFFYLLCSSLRADSLNAVMDSHLGGLGHRRGCGSLALHMYCRWQIGMKELV